MPNPFNLTDEELRGIRESLASGMSVNNVGAKFHRGTKLVVTVRQQLIDEGILPPVRKRGARIKRDRGKPSSPYEGTWLYSPVLDPNPRGRLVRPLHEEHEDSELPQGSVRRLHRASIQMG